MSPVVDITVLAERFERKFIVRDDGCWEWQANRSVNGYGGFWTGSKLVRAHRFAYELLVGPIPAGLDLDHLCRNRACVNPDHLEPVTRSENLRRGSRSGLKTHCAQGHPWTPENINTYHRLGGRIRACCKPCKAERDRRRHAARKAAS